MRRNLFLALVLMLTSCVAVIGEEQARAVCRMTTLPEDSKHLFAHGDVLHLYPPKVNKSYTGCVILASGRDQPATAYFENGELKRVQGYMSRDHPEVSCIYENR